MPYTPGNFTETAFKSGKNILASEHLQYTESGGTLDGAVIGNTYLPVGTALARNTTTGKYEVFSTTTGYDDLCILNIDVQMAGKDVVVGELIIRGSVYERKLPASVTAAFKTATRPLIRYVSVV